MNSLLVLLLISVSIMAWIGWAKYRDEVKRSKEFLEFFKAYQSLEWWQRIPSDELNAEISIKKSDDVIGDEMGNRKFQVSYPEFVYEAYGDSSKTH